MPSPKQISATEARQRFYQLLKQVSQGEDVIIRNHETGDAFQLVKCDPEKLGPGKVGLLEKLLAERPGLYPAHSPEEVKKIIAQSKDGDKS